MLKSLFKRTAALIISFFIICSFICVSAAESGGLPSVSAKGAALYCVDTGEFLFLKNADEKLPMASTTKIMTTLLTLERAAHKDETVEFKKEMLAEGSSMGLKLGYKLKLSDLAAGMMTVSGNDAANAAAIAISGSLEKFAGLMNKKAQELGMKNTSFVTPSGLDDKQHYSTAADMARLMEYSMQNKDFAKLASHKSVKVDFEYPENLSVTYYSHNKLLSRYEYCTGGKTGFTKRAGRCLVTAAEKDGKHLVAVTLKSGDDWNDHIKMFDYGFSVLEALHYDDNDYSVSLNVVGGDADYIKVRGGSDFDCVVKSEDKDKVKRDIYLPQFVYAPVKKGDAVGRIVYSLNGEAIGSTDIKAAEDCGAFIKQKSLGEKALDIIKQILGIYQN